jgi:hypothetical protein
MEQHQLIKLLESLNSINAQVGTLMGIEIYLSEINEKLGSVIQILERIERKT